MRRSSAALCCSALLAAFFASASHASTMLVRYQLAGQLGIVSGANFLPASGPIPVSGTMKIAYPSSATGPLSSMGNGFAPLPGPAVLQTGSFHVHETVLYGHVPGSMITGLVKWDIDFDLALAPGTLKATGTLLLPNIQPLGMGTFVCAGNPCFPSTSSIPQRFVVDRVFGLTALNHLVSGTLNAGAFVPKAFAFANAALGPLVLPLGLQITSASEIDRHLVPEPGSFPTTAAGLAALALFVAGRRHAGR